SGTGSPFDGVMNEFFFEDARSCGGIRTFVYHGFHAATLSLICSFVRSLGSDGAWESGETI
ncbi:MAG TPA: hypothetical protein VN833_31160, partial [Candidatus Acidoferrales bacterium]|nr:hypothetical protein [Candidatus Acidoferrales bacterium]